MLECEHQIGLSFDYEGSHIVGLKDIIENYERVQEYHRALIEEKDDFYLPSAKKDLKLYFPLSMVNGESPVMKRFDYCPHCGVKIDWDEIISLASEVE